MWWVLYSGLQITARAQSLIDLPNFLAPTSSLWHRTFCTINTDFIAACRGFYSFLLVDLCSILVQLAFQARQFYIYIHWWGCKGQCHNLNLLIHWSSTPIRPRKLSFQHKLRTRRFPSINFCAPWQNEAWTVVHARKDSTSFVTNFPFRHS